jgi:hypothetical protein
MDQNLEHTIQNNTELLEMKLKQLKAQMSKVEQLITDNLNASTYEEAKRVYLEFHTLNSL